jgi:surface antigen
MTPGAGTDIVSTTEQRQGPRRLIIPLLALLLVVCMAQPTSAQLINPFRGNSRTPLNTDDITALTDATARLFDQPNLASGQSETWSNPKSGASGTVTAGNPLKRHGLVCRVMTYDTLVPGPRPERRTTLTICKTPQGLRIG